MTGMVFDLLLAALLVAAALAAVAARGLFAGVVFFVVYGVLIAATWLLAAMAGAATAPRVTSLALRVALVAGPVLFLAVGMAGALGGSFLGLTPEWAGALVLTIEVALTLSIASTLALLVLGPPERPA